MSNMQFANNAATTLASSITNSQTSISVASSSTFPAITGNQYFYCTLIGASNSPIEIVKVTAISGTTWTVVRAQDGTTGSVFSSGDSVQLRLVAANLNDFPKLDENNTFTTGAITLGSTALGAGNASIMKNRIINGAMVIDQRNAGASVTATTASLYTLDRWQAIASVSSKYTVQQNAGSVTPPVGFSNYLGITSSSAYSVLAGDYFSLVQKIEGYNVADLGFGSANAKTVTLSFWVRSSLTGTFGGGIANGGGTRWYPFSYTISSANTWEQKSITIAGDTTGTWVTTSGIGILTSFALGYGSTYGNGTAGAWTSSDFESVTGAVSVVGTSGATFYITGVQLEVGSSATGFEYVNYQTSLANCQRYYEFGNLYATGYGNGTNAVQFSYPMKVTKRTTPTGTVTDVNSTNYSSISFVGNDSNSVYISGTASSGYSRAIVSVTIIAEL